MLELRRLGYDHPDAVALTARLQEFYAERYGDGDADPTDPAHFAAPQGLFLIGYVDDVPVAMGGWRIIDLPRNGFTRVAELKRMYVVPEAARHGHGNKVLVTLESAARAVGVDTIVLSTGGLQTEAIGLYEKKGYVEIEPFGHYAGLELNRCYGKRLNG